MHQSDGALRCRDLKHLFGRRDVVMIYRRDRVLTAAQKKFIEAISRDEESASLNA